MPVLGEKRIWRIRASYVVPLSVVVTPVDGRQDELLNSTWVAAWTDLFFHLTSAKVAYARHVDVGGGSR
jgi:hypothetical protein